MGSVSWLSAVSLSLTLQHEKGKCKTNIVLTKITNCTVVATDAGSMRERNLCIENLTQFSPSKLKNLRFCSPRV